MKTFFQFIAIGIAIVFVIAIIAAFTTFIGVIVGLMLLAWACGVPITITTNGNKEVYRWTKRIK